MGACVFIKGSLLSCSNGSIELFLRNSACGFHFSIDLRVIAITRRAMHTNTDGWQDECMLIRNTQKELLCKFNQEQNTSTGVFFFFFLLFLIRLSYFPQAGIFWLLLQLPKPHRSVYITSNATTCNTLLYKQGILLWTKGSYSEIKRTAQVFLQLILILKNSILFLLFNIIEKNPTLVQQLCWWGWGVFVLQCLQKRTHFHCYVHFYADDTRLSWTALLDCL